MKVLFIGGTGFISTSVSRLALARGIELYLLNRGLRKPDLAGARNLTADIRQPELVRAALGDLKFDAVVDWIAYTPEDIERDLAIFRGRTRQFIFISSASAYQKPPGHHVIRESHPCTTLIGIIRATKLPVKSAWFVPIARRVFR